MNFGFLAAGVVVLLGALFAWGYVRLHGHSNQIVTALAAIDPAEIPALAAACSHVFAKKLESPLDSGNPLASAGVLDAAIRSQQMINAFARQGLEWAYALHVGAYLGELIRMHTGGEWRVTEDGAPELFIQKGEAKITLWPFDKVLKHRSIGDPGDLVAYVEVALRAPDEFAAEFERTGS